MAQIAEDLFLLLLDNASGQPGLDKPRRERVLAAAVLLDLAHACLIRPALPEDPVEDGLLVALATYGPMDPVIEPAFRLLQRRPLPPAAAVGKLRKHAQENLTQHLEQTGQIRRIRLQSKRFNAPYAWPLTNRERVGPARDRVLGALFDGHPPTPPTAAIISLLHAVDGLGALLSLNDRGWRWVHARATEISTGGWLDDAAATELPDMNLVFTTAAVRSALM
jgi:Golgi phosphoprotein 3 (GPP34)